MKNSLTFILFIFVLIAKAQTNTECQKNEDFQLKLQQFRYTLYADLMPQKENISAHMDSFFTDTSSVVYKKSMKFYKDNYTTIKDFQRYDLNKYTAINIDFSKFVLDTTFNAIISDSVIWSFFSTYISSYSNLTFSPVSYAFTINSLLLSRIKTPSEIGTTSIINNLASPLVKTKMLQNNKWEITIDNYEYIFVHEYNLSDNKIKVTKVYKRM